MVKKYKLKNNHKRWLIVTPIVLIIAGAALFALEKTNTTSIFSSNTNSSDHPAQTTSDLPSAQSDYSDDHTSEENKNPGNTLNENQGSAIITDNNGASSTDTSSPRISSTGEITVYLPLDKAILRNGQELSGISNLSQIQYRLIDSVSGVIATGSLKVINGKFSGSISFSTSASEGRLDIFGVKADASEFSSIEIPVRFQ